MSNVVKKQYLISHSVIFNFKRDLMQELLSFKTSRCFLACLSEGMNFITDDLILKVILDSTGSFQKSYRMRGIIT